ncbi:DUF1311 domain-containing protein [Alcaligenaceae bacterium CGII-47]|nr:DUF1311 domain-containing protein [Alcaligenaceae bacterium CGII-47]
MKTTHALTVLTALACLSFSTQAQENNLNKQYSACMDRSGGVTEDMIDCMTAEHQRQDGRLNKAYKALMDDLDAERKNQLKTAQRAWIKFRDANCDFYYDPDGGSMARVSANDCMISMTANRAHELENLRQ